MRPAVAAALLLAAVAAVYAPVLDHSFVDLDDPTYVLDNERLREGLGPRAVARDFREPYFGNWAPLTSLSLRVDYALYGLRPRGYLVTNVALHGLATVLLLAALVRMTGATGPSAFVAGVFALHPLHVESVAWVSERKDVLSGVFFAAALLAYARYAERPSRLRMGVVSGVFALGLMAKSSVVTLPAVLLLLDVWPLGRLGPSEGRAAAVRTVVIEKLPLFALAAAASLVTVAVQGSAGAVAELEGIPLAIRAGNGLRAYVIYLGQTLWPAGLTAFYPHPLGALPATQVLASAALLAAISAGVVWSRRRVLAVGWLWYLGVLVPMIGLVQVGMQAHADRYTYLAQIGLSIMLAWGISDWAGPSRARILGAAGAVALLALAWASARQLPHWRDAVAVHRRCVEVDPDNFRAWDRLGRAYTVLGRTAEARHSYTASIRAAPRRATGRLGLAGVALTEGDVERAIEAYAHALELEPRHFIGRLNYGNALATAGRDDDARVQYEWCIANATESDRILGDAALPHFRLGELLHQRGELDASVQHLRAGLAIAPLAAAAWTRLGNVELELGNIEAAETALARAEAQGDRSARRLAGSARVSHTRGRVAAAIRDYRLALALDPGQTTAACELAWLLATAPAADGGDGKRAVQVAEAARRLAPDDPHTHLAVSRSLALAGRRPEARRAAENALALAEARGESGLAATARRLRQQIEGGEPPSPPTWAGGASGDPGGGIGSPPGRSE